MTGTNTIPCARMLQLLEQGRAQPLLEGHFPVPVNLDGQWWHVPAAGPGENDDGPPEEFVPASTEQAALFELLAARRRAADLAQQQHDDGGRP